MTGGMGKWHDARLAGRWFSANASALRDDMRHWLDGATPPSMPLVRSLIVPHAGYIYSGSVAAQAYATLRSVSYARVVLLAPSHFSRFRGVAVLRWDGFETPLGRVGIDRETVQRLLAQPCFVENDTAYDEEHALEIQLPFVRMVLPQAKLVPLLVGDLTAEDNCAVADALRPLDDGDTLFVVSSDFIHYGSRFDYLPFPADERDRVKERLRALDLEAIDLVCAGDLDGFRRYLSRTGATICGRAPIAVFLELHRRRSVGRLLCYRTSLDVTGDYEHSVSYASIAFAAS
ncbi:MAG: AmmeMemoRadiSam system protein B [Deltaproteobacteria bacterium]|nr:AmmeMemoRadiSam system protein B [Deltaproteobacteria bacterium]